MLTALARFCGLMWLLGFAGMWVTKGLFDLGMGSMPFEIFARFWGVGGLSLAFVTGLMVLGDPRRIARQLE